MKVILTNEKLDYDFEIDSEDIKRLVKENVIELLKKTNTSPKRQ